MVKVQWTFSPPNGLSREGQPWSIQRSGVSSGTGAANAWTRMSRLGSKRSKDCAAQEAEHGWKGDRPRCEARMGQEPNRTACQSNDTANASFVAKRRCNLRPPGEKCGLAVVRLAWRRRSSRLSRRPATACSGTHRGPPPHRTHSGADEPCKRSGRGGSASGGHPS